MPFTPSHAAVAPMLQRLIRPLGVVIPVSAIVVGTMTPDFEYLLRLAPGGGAWHTKVGLLEFCVPAGLAVWLIFRAIVGPALLRLLPDEVGKRLGKRVSAGPVYRLIPGASAAILVGAVSHDFWDSFTHEQGWGVRQLPLLRHAIRLSTYEWIRGYSILQYASSALGLAVLVVIAWRWVASEPAAVWQMPPKERGWRIRVVGLLGFVSLLGALLNSMRSRPQGFSWAIGYATVGGMSALVAGLFLYGILDWLRHSYQVTRETIARSNRCSESGT